MPTAKKTLRHLFRGGWATEYGQSVDVAVSQTGIVEIPFLLDAKNVTFELDGGTHKIGGTTQMNATQIDDGGGAEPVVGMYDYWRQGAVGSPAREIVCHSGTAMWAANLDGNFSSVITGLSDGAVVSYATFDDLLIIGSDSDVPQQYDQTAGGALTGSPPNCSFFVEHKNRMWGAGDPTNPSLLYYSVLEDPQDWIGEGSGLIQISPQDGDGITGLRSHKDNLWVFKGPHKGSIHRVVGSAPTGSDSFGRLIFIRGIGAVSHNTIFSFKDDIGFMWNDGSVHSLNATASYGDFNEASLSREINNWLRDHVNGSSLNRAWAVDFADRGYVLFTIAIDSSSTNNYHLLMDYRFNPVRWSYWDAFDSSSLATVIDSRGFSTLFGGSTDGYVRRLQRNTKSVDGVTAIAADTITPYMHYGEPYTYKVIERASVGISPKGNYDLTFGWTRDERPEQIRTVGQGSSGAVIDEFTLDSDVLAGANYADRFMSLEEGGEFRYIRYRVSSTGIDEDLELRSISATLGRGAESGEN